MPKMRVLRFFQNPVGAISNAFELNHQKSRLGTLDQEKQALEKELEFASYLGDVNDSLDAMDVATRRCYDLLTSALGKMKNLPRDDESVADVSDEDARFCTLLKAACAVTNRSESSEDGETREMVDEGESDSRIRALLHDYRECVSRKQEAHARNASPFRHRLYRCVDKQLSELHEFRDELRKQTQVQFSKMEELKAVNQKIREAEEKLNAVRQKQFG